MRAKQLTVQINISKIVLNVVIGKKRFIKLNILEKGLIKTHTHIIYIDLYYQDKKIIMNSSVMIKNKIMYIYVIRKEKYNN